MNRLPSARLRMLRARLVAASMARQAAMADAWGRPSGPAALLARLVADVEELPCIGAFCEGPDAPRTSMVTCRCCWAKQTARGHVDP